MVNDRLNTQYTLDDCINSLTDLAICLRAKNALIRKLRNCNQAFTDAFSCMYVSPATLKAFADFEDENDALAVLPETQRGFHRYHKGNDDIDVIMPETRTVLAPYEQEENGGDGIVVKRGLGRCIHRCLKGPGGMSFIQCKSMCHR